MKAAAPHGPSPCIHASAAFNNLTVGRTQTSVAMAATTKPMRTSRLREIPPSHPPEPWWSRGSDGVDGSDGTDDADWAKDDIAGPLHTRCRSYGDCQFS